MKTALAVLAALLGAAAWAAEVDGVAARVGAATILRSDVVDEMRRAHITDPSRFNEVRNELIDRKLILQAAGEAKMSLQDWVVENNIRAIINRSFGGDRNRLMAQLSSQHVQYADWRQRIVDDMVVSAMRYQMIDRNQIASPEAMAEEYRAHPERYTLGRRVTVSVILLKPEDSGKRAEIGKLLKTRSFPDVAREFSADSHAVDGGCWADVDPDEVFRPEVCEEIAKMPLGTISRWIDLDGWSFLLRKDAENVAAKRSFAEAYDDIAERVRTEAAEKAYREWVARLRAKTYIKVY